MEKESVLLSAFLTESIHNGFIVKRMKKYHLTIIRPRRTNVRQTFQKITCTYAMSVFRNFLWHLDKLWLINK